MIQLAQFDHYSIHSSHLLKPDQISTNIVIIIDICRELLNIFSSNCAEGGTRTRTRFPPLPPQDSVSPSSTTSAINFIQYPGSVGYQGLIDLANVDLLHALKWIHYQLFQEH